MQDGFEFHAEQLGLPHHYWRQRLDRGNLPTNNNSAITDMVVAGKSIRKGRWPHRLANAKLLPSPSDLPARRQHVSYNYRPLAQASTITTPFETSWLLERNSSCYVSPLSCILTHICTPKQLLSATRVSVFGELPPFT